MPRAARRRACCAVMAGAEATCTTRTCTTRTCPVSANGHVLAAWRFPAKRFGVSSSVQAELCSTCLYIMHASELVAR
eukprot:981950-Prymnesium_polylepis.1